MRNLIPVPLLILAFALTPLPAGADREARRSPIVIAVEAGAPSAVSITSVQQVSQPNNPFFRGNPFFEQFMREYYDPRPRTSQSLGTGVIIGNGYVLSNEHVLAGAMEIRVMLPDGREFNAELVGGDPATDLAVARIVTDEELPAATIGDSDQLMVGETVVAVGNAFGLNHTVTTGVLSAINRSLRTGEREYHGFLQTDASINPGNSGGPLLNIDGELIGINTAILGKAEGIGFAIPINRARRVVDDLIRYGEVVPTWLGLRLQEMTPALRGALASESNRGGVLVSYVFPDSPGDRAGLRSGDILLELDGTRIRELRNYFELLRGLTEGDKATAAVERSDDTVNLHLIAEAFPEARAEELGEILLGVEVTNLTLELATRHGLAARNGLLVTRVIPSGPAALRGLRPGDVILKVNQDRVEDRVAFRRAITKLRGHGRALLLVQRGVRGYPVSLELS